MKRCIQRVAICALVVFVILILGRRTFAKYQDMPELIRQGNDFFNNGQYTEAAASYKEALLQGDSAAAVYNLALTYHHKLNYYAKALHYYQKFLELEPNAAEAEQVKKWVIELRQRIFPEDSQNDPLLKRAKAVDFILAAGADDAQTAQGNEYLKQKKYDKAIQAYEQALVQDKSAAACHNLALVYDFDLGYKQRGVFYYQQFLAMAPKHSQAEKVTQWLAQAKTNFEQKKGNLSQGTAFSLRQP